MKVESDGGEDDQEGDDGEEGHGSAEKDDVVVGVIQIQLYKKLHIWEASCKQAYLHTRHNLVKLVYRA